MMRALAAIACATCGAAHACGIAGDRIASGVHYTVAYRTSPATIRTGEHFAVAFAVCPVGKAPMPRTVRVDASMPAHRHGMNYKPTVSAQGRGVYRAEGLLFHMGGHWEIAFDIASPAATERITSTMDLR